MSDEEAQFAFIVAFSALMLAILTLTMILRLYTRISVLKKTGWEDWTVCVAFLLYVASLSMAPSSIRLGLLKPADQIIPQNKISLSKISHANEILYAPTIAFAKLSILLQMIRMFVPIDYTKSWYFMVTFTTVNMSWFTVIFFVTVFQCTPVAKVWDPLLPGHCIDYANWIVVAGAFNMTSDLVMLALPIMWIWRLHLDFKRKLTGGAVFVVGALACAASIVRFYFSFKHLENSRSAKPDAGSLVAVASCTSAEVAAAIICANLPNLPALLRHLVVPRSKVRENDGMRFFRNFIHKSNGAEKIAVDKAMATTSEASKVLGPTPSKVSGPSSNHEAKARRIIPAEADIDALPDLVFLTEENDDVSASMRK